MLSHTLPSNMQIAKKFAQISSAILKYLAAGKICSLFSKRERMRMKFSARTPGVPMCQGRAISTPTQGAHERTFPNFHLKTITLFYR